MRERYLHRGEALQEKFFKSYLAVGVPWIVILFAV
jgi:hypothetical protein